MLCVEVTIIYALAWERAKAVAKPIPVVQFMTGTTFISRASVVVALRNVVIHGEWSRGCGDCHMAGLNAQEMGRVLHERQ